jgi:hypothetical protein
MFRTTGYLSVLLFGFSIAVPMSSLQAQQIAVQQPVVGVFSGTTTVSVPDRGRAFVGGVGRSASSSSIYGPLRTNSNYGRSTAGTSVSVHVWIHDFEELDRQALQAASESRTRTAGSRPVSRADQAYVTLSKRSRGERTDNGAVASGESPQGGPRADASGGPASIARRARRSLR